MLPHVVQSPSRTQQVGSGGPTPRPSRTMVGSTAPFHIPHPLPCHLRAGGSPCKMKQTRPGVVSPGHQPRGPFLRPLTPSPAPSLGRATWQPLPMWEILIYVRDWHLRAAM